MVLCIWICVHICLCVTVFLYGYVGVCVSLIDGRVKIISFSGILTDHIASFRVKELDGTRSQRHDKDCVCGNT